MMPPFVHRYASLYFCLAVENQENELLGLEVIHRYVELLDKYFGNVIPSRVTTCLFTIHLLELLLTVCMFFVVFFLFFYSENLPSGVWAGHNLQLWEGLFYPGWVSNGRRSAGDFKTDSESLHRGLRHAAGGESRAWVHDAINDAHIGVIWVVLTWLLPYVFLVLPGWLLIRALN